MTEMGDRDDTILVHEIYLSIQGESTWAGCPCVFIRLTGCPLRCTYCDTEYAFTGGTLMTIQAVLEKIRPWACPLVEVTGGEPLAQKRCPQLLRALLDEGYMVLLETSGALPLDGVPYDVRKIVDFKCPSSGEIDRNCWRNVELLAPHDEVKFVIGTREDYDWAREMVAAHDLVRRCRAVLFSTVFGSLSPATLAAWMLEDRLYHVRLQLQLHKYIWPPEMRGV